MRSISYRARARWRKGLTVGLFAMALLLLAGVLFVIYLGRFVVYTPSGARLDFGRDSSRDVVIEATESAPTVPLETDAKLKLGYVAKKGAKLTTNGQNFVSALARKLERYATK